jgi:DNA-binding transcriptional MerR regulator
MHMKEQQLCRRCNSDLRLVAGRYRCVPCARRSGREYYERSEHRRHAMRRTHIRRKYGVSLEQLEAILEKQNGACAICFVPWSQCSPAKRPRSTESFLQFLCVDHDHYSHVVRGLLCNACNTGLGVFGEDIERIKRAISYLIRAKSDQ